MRTPEGMDGTAEAARIGLNGPPRPAAAGFGLVSLPDRAGKRFADKLIWEPKKERGNLQGHPHSWPRRCLRLRLRTMHNHHP